MHDQALEQRYNRPAKVSGGIIGVTRKKEAVALWGIIVGLAITHTGEAGDVQDAGGRREEGRARGTVS